MAYRNLRAEMARNDVTRQQLADVIGLKSDRSVDVKLRGKAGWNKAQIDKVCAFFGMPYEYLFKWEE